MHDHVLHATAEYQTEPLVRNLIRRASWGVSSVTSRLEVGSVYLEAGEARTPVSWFEQVPVSERYQQYERDALLLAAFTQADNQPRSAAIRFGQLA